MLESELVKHWHSLKRLVQSIVKDPYLTDDVLQTAFVKALTTRSHPSSESKILPWFKVVLKRTALDIIKEQHKFQEKGWEHDIDDIVEDKSFESSACQCVVKLLSHLSSKDRDLLKTLDIDGESLKHLEDKTGLSRNTLKVRRHRARQRLKKVVMDICNIRSAQDCEDCNCSW